MIRQAWLDNLELCTSLTPLALLIGERIHDRFVLPASSNTQSARLASLSRCVWEVLGAHYDALVEHDPLMATTTLRFRRPGAELQGDLMRGLNEPGDVSEMSFDAMLNAALEHPAAQRIVIWIPDAHFLFGDHQPTTPQRMLRLQRHAELAIPGEANRMGPLLLLSFRTSAHIPSELQGGNVRQIRLGSAARDERAAYVKQFGGHLGPTDIRHTMGERLVALTEGDSLNTLQRILDLAGQRQLTSVSQLEHLTRAVREGLQDTPWAGADLRKALGEARERFSNRIKGQSAAVDHAIQLLIRSAMNLSGAHQSHSNQGPRAVLFLAGPTGVGKTELAKSIAEMVFGDEGAIVRFDMGEFGDAHADARLIGAPPGYVGFSQGGELTEAIRNRPFSVLLFDEIEKAHPRILDKFLSLLDDGRVTDGQGQRAYFGETVVIFTSNLGTRDISPDLPHEEMDASVRERIEHHFRNDIGRPELLGRIGLDNLIVFDFIRDDIARQVISKMLQLVRDRVLQSQACDLTLNEQARTELENLCLSPEVLALGGRQIAKTIESRLVTPLAEALFNDPMQEATVESIRPFVLARSRAS